MMRLAEIPKRASQRAQGESKEACPAGAASIEAMDMAVAAHAFGHAENVRGRNPVSILYGRVADHKEPICSFIVNNASVYCYSSVISVKYNASKENRAGGQRLDENALFVADGWMHAETAGAEGDGYLLLEQRDDDFLSCGHDGDGFRMEKV